MKVYSLRRKQLTLFSIVLFGGMMFLIKIGKDNYDVESAMVELRMRGPLASTDEQLVKFVKEKYLIPPSTLPYNLTILNKKKHRKMYNSDKVNDFAYKNLETKLRLLYPSTVKKDGFFIEAGAFDGEFSSNSLYLEIDLGWQGLLVEPDADLFKVLLRKRRKAWACHCCFSNKPYPHKTVLSKVDFEPSKAELFGGHRVALYGRILNSIAESWSSKDRSDFGHMIYEEVQCLPIATLMAALNRTHVDVFSLDIEGMEFEVLRSLPWSKLTVDVWMVEHRNPHKKFLHESKDPEFIKWFELKGYVLFHLASNLNDYIFIKKDSDYYRKNRIRLNI